MSSSFLFGIQFIRSYAEGTISRKPTPYFETPQFQDILDNNSFKAMKPDGSNMEEPWFSGDNGTNPVVRMFLPGGSDSFHGCCCIAAWKKTWHQKMCPKMGMPSIHQAMLAGKSPIDECMCSWKNHLRMEDFRVPCLSTGWYPNNPIMGIWGKG